HEECVDAGEAENRAKEQPDQAQVDPFEHEDDRGDDPADGDERADRDRDKGYQAGAAQQNVHAGAAGPDDPLGPGHLGVNLILHLLGDALLFEDFWFIRGKRTLACEGVDTLFLSGVVTDPGKELTACPRAYCTTPSASAVTTM